jgi:hypothetical protein
MRTLQLTNEQISLLKQALGIAEIHFLDIHQEISQKTINVRGMEISDDKTSVKFYFEKACLFADFNTSLGDGTLDI